MLVLATLALEMCFASLGLGLQDRQTCYVRQYHRIWKGNQLSLTCLCIHMAFVTVCSCCALSVLHCALSNLFCALCSLFLLCPIRFALCTIRFALCTIRFAWCPVNSSVISFCALSLLPCALSVAPCALSFVPHGHVEQVGMSSTWACRTNWHVEQLGMSKSEKIRKSENLKNCMWMKGPTSVSRSFVIFGFLDLTCQTRI